MKILSVILLLLLTTSASADCVMFSGGVEKACPPKVTPAPPSAQALMNICQVSVHLAHDAYLQTTFDAQLPDIDGLIYVVDYLADMSTMRVDRTIAKHAVVYIAKRLNGTKQRRPYEGTVYDASVEFIKLECYGNGR